MSSANTNIYRVFVSVYLSTYLTPAHTTTKIIQGPSPRWTNTR